MKVDALILSGGKRPEKITREGSSVRGLIEIKGKPMLDYILAAVKSSPSIDRIVLVISSTVGVRDWGSRIEVVAGNGSITQNIQTGLNRLGEDKPVLTLAADIPLITPQAIEDFLARCEKKEAQVYYPIIPRREVEEKFPGSKRTYVTLKEGTFTGGNLALVIPSVIRENASLVEDVYRLRKSPIRLARILGLKFILKFLARRLSLKEVEKVASQLIKAKGCAIIAPYPEIGVDVDKDSDLEAVEKLIGSTSN